MSGSGWPVPLIELRTTHQVRFVSDNAGVTRVRGAVQFTKVGDAGAVGATTAHASSCGAKPDGQ